MTTTTVLAYIPSPPQGVWHLGPFPIRAYALLIIVGIIVGCWWGSRRWIARGGQEGEVLDIAVWAVPFGLIGGRIYHVMTDWSTYFGADAVKHPIDALKVWEGGLGIWGAVAFGALGAWIGCRRHGIKLGPFGDAIAPAILLAQAIGRIGNYFNQELFGGTTTLPWGLEIFDRRNSYGVVGPSVIDGVSTGHVNAGLAPAVHPTFLYELLWNVFVVLVLVTVDRYLRVGHGRLFALYVAGYCMGRFGIELMRTDHATQILGIRINVFTAAIVFACAAAYFVLAPKGRELGLTMYQPWRAAELEGDGVIGYVDPYDDDDDLDDAATGDDRDRAGDSHAQSGATPAVSLAKTDDPHDDVATVHTDDDGARAGADSAFDTGAAFDTETVDATDAGDGAETDATTVVGDERSAGTESLDPDAGDTALDDTESDAADTAVADAPAGTAAVDAAVADSPTGTAAADTAAADSPTGTAAADTADADAQTGTTAADNAVADAQTGTAAVDPAVADAPAGTAAADTGVADTEADTSTSTAASATTAAAAAAVTPAVVRSAVSRSAVTKSAVTKSTPTPAAEADTATADPADTSSTDSASDDVERIVSATREIAAPAATIFDLIADPARQPSWDGNDNLAEAAQGQRVHKVGDVFTTLLTRGQERRNHIVEFDEGKLIAWLPSELGGTPPGHLWRWQLSAVDDTHTLVTHTYDWTRLNDPTRLERARWTTADKLQASVDRLARAAEEQFAAGEAADEDNSASKPNITPNIVKRADSGAAKTD
ncbi:prolipoprotein diacylglyceryl transferase [Gordonia asplenii]|uniref:prolipoprotein diacylglyceryl transferase n=1 Tax=Gordonia asplenii TaxID=2725283 RepID=UPI0028A5ED24|nr:prolipoprotein diacylglyceryl transferase [Gordonia asplenii]